MQSSSRISHAFHSSLTYVFPENCFEEIVLRFNIFHAKCFRMVLSRCLGLAIIFGSVLIKIPQILKIVHGKSGAGVSLLSNFLELLCFLATVSYSCVSGFNFSAWGDSLTVGIQTAIVAFLIMWYSSRQSEAIVFSIAVSLSAILLCSGLVPLNILAILQSLNIPMVVVAKAIQALENFRNKSTGQLSPITVFMQYAGCAARIFTSVQETGDKLLITTYIVATIMNGVIFGQILMYWGQKMPKKIE